MTETIQIPLHAALFDPNDPAEVSIFVDAVSLGTTKQLATGQTLTWDEESMQKFFPTFAGTPINASIDKQTGQLTKHSREVVGTIQKAVYDAENKKISVKGALWNHYFPETIKTLKDLKAQSKMQASMEFLADELRDNGDGTVTPIAGRFSGLGLIPDGADLNNSVLLLASALETDKKETPVVTVNTTTSAPAGSYEWVSLKAAEHFANMGSVENPYTASVVGTFNNAIVYNDGSETFRMDYDSTTDGSITFGEPVKVNTTFVPLVASRKDDETLESGVVINMPDEKEFEELKASKSVLETELAELRPIKAAYEELQASVKAKEEEAAKELLASTRLAEVEKIRPYDSDELKSEHKEIFKTADEKTFNTIKALMAGTVEKKGGIPSEAHAATGGDRDPGELEAETKLPAWRDELLAAYKPAQPKQ
jgi:hypothetical protein